MHTVPVDISARLMCVWRRRRPPQRWWCFMIVLVLRRRAVLRLVLEIQSGPRGTRQGAFKERICANDRSLRRILLHASVDSAGRGGSLVATWWFGPRRVVYAHVAPDLPPS